MGRTADEHKEIGKMFGFPDCCIDDFNSRDIAPEIDRKLCGTGYIPCQDCNDRYTESELIENISHNRLTLTEFPNGGIVDIDAMMEARK